MLPCSGGMQLPGSDGRRPPSFLIRTLLVLSRTIATFLTSLLQLPKACGLHADTRTCNFVLDTRQCGLVVDAGPAKFVLLGTHPIKGSYAAAVFYDGVHLFICATHVLFVFGEN